MPVATVIVPVGEKHLPLLPRALASVRAQTIPTEALYIIDYDGKGPGWGRNQLAKQAKTPFLVFLDADDWLLPTFVEKTLDTWMRCNTPGYVTSDWYQGDRHVKAMTCYGVQRNPGEAPFHLPPSLFPTKLFHAVGGFDETLFGAEDTDLFWRVNAMGISHTIVREPLFHYTPDGYRSKQAGSDPRWMELLNGIAQKVKGRLSMARCGGCGRGNTDPINQNERKADDILARPRSQAMTRQFGMSTRTPYGRISAKHSVWVRKEDFNERQWERVVDVAATLPTDEEIDNARNTPPKVDLEDFDRSDPLQMEAAVRQVGTREWRADGNHGRHGFDIQQTPSEIAELLVLAHQRGVKRVLEIGTGESAGLARFMVEVMGWDVVSIDLERPTTDLLQSTRWGFIHSDSRKVDIAALKKDHGAFDMVIIDGDHSFEGAKSDWERYSRLAPLVVLHDISPDGWWGKDDASGGFWRSIAKGPKGGLKKGFREIVAPLDTQNNMAAEGRQGIGYFTND